MNIHYIKGDLFDSNDSLCHCVSEDMHMGKGIATQFKKRFKNVNNLKNQMVETGGVAVLEVEKPQPRFIYYLVTKKKYYKKPTYKTLRSSLTKMRDHMKDNNVTKISMPLIGCGLDKLEWDRVSTMLEEIFEDCNVDITVYKL